MDFKVLITDAAVADLENAEDDPSAAHKPGEKLIAAGLSLARMPDRFPLHERARGIHKMSIPPSLLFYSCDHTARIVWILHFWHGARRQPRFRA
ncbi:MAG: type II toxin-antitoxin system RelE/ParE family toxin [Spartobacteria bacterium]